MRSIRYNDRMEYISGGRLNIGKVCSSSSELSSSSQLFSPPLSWWWRSSLSTASSSSKVELCPVFGVPCVLCIICLFRRCCGRFSSGGGCTTNSSRRSGCSVLRRRWARLNLWRLMSYRISNSRIDRLLPPAFYFMSNTFQGP